MEEGEAETDSEGAEQVGEGEGSEWESDDEDVGVWRVLAEEREGIEARRMERRLKKLRQVSQKSAEWVLDGPIDRAGGAKDKTGQKRGLYLIGGDSERTVRRKKAKIWLLESRPQESNQVLRIFSVQERS